MTPFTFIAVIIVVHSRSAAEKAACSTEGFAENRIVSRRLEMCQIGREFCVRMAYGYIIENIWTLEKLRHGEF